MFLVPRPLFGRPLCRLALTWRPPGWPADTPSDVSLLSRGEGRSVYIVSGAGGSK